MLSRLLPAMVAGLTLLAPAAVASVALSGGALAETTPVGVVDKVQEKAVALQGTASRDLAASGPILYRDRLRTGPGARLEAKLDDGTVLTLGEKGKLTVDDFVYHPGAGGGRLALSVPTGAFLFVGGKIEGPTGGNVAITTPVGTLGVRGTTVWGGHIDGGFGVLVLSGEVVLHTRHGDVTMRKGQGTMVYAGKRPTAAAPWPDDRTKRAVATISFAAQHAEAPQGPPPGMSDAARRRFLSGQLVRKPD